MLRAAPTLCTSTRALAVESNRSFTLTVYVTLALCLAIAAASPGRATSSPRRLLSPGGGTAASPALAAPCPTFSWAGVPDAGGYELVVFHVAVPSNDGTTSPSTTLTNVALDDEPSLGVVLRQRLPAGATSWTPDLRSCLAAGGRFAWSLRVLGSTRGKGPARDPGEWAEPVWLEVSAEPSLDEVDRALDVLQRHRASRGRGTAPTVDRSARRSVAGAPRFEPLRQSTVGPRTASAAAAPVLGAASLTVAKQVHLANSSAVFKGVDLFLWDEVVSVYGIPRGSTALGRGALDSNFSSLPDETYGASNTALGYRSLTANTSGYLNTATGAEALRANTYGYANTATGALALHQNVSGNYNTANGNDALSSNTTGSANMASGAYALFKSSTGSDNTASGTTSLLNNTTGSFNTAGGSNALRNNVSGNRNTALGYRAGASTTGSSNILINSAGAASESNTLRIGEGFGTGTGQLASAFIHGIFGSGVAGATDMPVLVDGTGKLGTTTSSARFKQDIADIDEHSGRLLALRPVSFRYRPETGRGESLRFGLIAEEVAQVFPELVDFDEQGRPFSVKYHLMTALLLDLLQEQQRELAALREEFALANGLARPGQRAPSPR